MTKAKKKTPAKKPAAKAKTKTARKKLSKPMAKSRVAPARAKAVKAAARPAAKPAVAKSAAAKPIAAKAASKSTATKSATAKPAATKPAATKPAVTKPAATKPAVTKPAVARPVVNPAAVKPVEKPTVTQVRTPPAAVAMPAMHQRISHVPQSAARSAMTGPVVATPASKKLAFKINDLVVYPAHGVGKVTMIEEQEIAGARLELYIVDFEKEKLRLKVPTGRAEQKGMRRLSDRAQIEQTLRVLKGRARIKRTMWSRRAQEYDAKINSGDLIAVAEVVRDLYRSERQPEQSYSERQLFEQALDRMAREIAAVKKIDDDQAIKELQEFLSKNARRVPVPGEKIEEEVASEKAA